MGLLKSIKDVIVSAKDGTASHVLEMVIAEKLSRYAEILSVEIDSREKTVSIFARNWKDKKEYSLRIEGCRLESVDNDNILSFQRISTSEHFINELFNNKRIVIPEKYGTYFNILKQVF